MKKAICLLLAALVVVLGSATAQAASSPPIAGVAQGLELCPKFICGVAIFAGGFQGQIGINPSANAIVATALDHGELPTEINESTPIFPGGVWELKTLFRRFNGFVTGGSIVYTGNKQFHVTIHMVVINGGSGNLTFDGTLDHNPPIPTFIGTLN